MRHLKSAVPEHSITVSKRQGKGRTTEKVDNLWPQDQPQCQRLISSSQTNARDSWELENLKTQHIVKCCCWNFGHKLWVSHRIEASSHLHNIPESHWATNALPRRAPGSPPLCRNYSGGEGWSVEIELLYFRKRCPQTDKQVNKISEQREK